LKIIITDNIGCGKLYFKLKLFLADNVYFDAISYTPLYDVQFIEK
jgi:hypothetical protein